MNKGLTRKNEIADMLSLILGYLGLALILAGVAWGVAILHCTRPKKTRHREAFSIHIGRPRSFVPKGLAGMK